MSKPILVLLCIGLSGVGCLIAFQAMGSNVGRGGILHEKLGLVFIGYSLILLGAAQLIRLAGRSFPFSMMMVIPILCDPLVGSAWAKEPVLNEIGADQIDQYISNAVKAIERSKIIIDGRVRPMGEISVEFASGKPHVFIDIKDEPNGDLLINLERLESAGEKRGGSVPIMFLRPKDGGSGPTCSANLLGRIEKSGHIRLTGTMESNGTCKRRKFDLRLHEALFQAGDSQITVKDKSFHLSGVLGTTTYGQVKNAVEAHPDIKTLVFGNSPGSINDAVNVHTGRLIRNAGLITVVTAQSEISSGAVDLFAAGVERIFHHGAKVGVHTWCCFDGKSAAELPEGHAAHRPLLDYTTEMLGPKLGREFYFFTLAAAPRDSVKQMTGEELLRYGLATKIK